RRTWDVARRAGDCSEVVRSPAHAVTDTDREDPRPLPLERVGREDRLLGLDEAGVVAGPRGGAAREGGEAVGDDDGEVEVLLVGGHLVDAAVPVGPALRAVAVDPAVDPRPVAVHGDEVGVVLAAHGGGSW